MTAPLHYAIGKAHRVVVEVSPNDEDGLIRWRCECGAYGADAPVADAYEELAAGERHVAEARAQSARHVT